MKNNTRSKIVIEMKNIDMANKLYLFIKKASYVGKMGGDFTLSFDGAEKESMCIGHDVNILKVEHLIEGQPND